ncbi:hypothetical protein SADUNF_Sadunf13G0117200 [Salix dunnii]|uniref:Pentatricopeptide repeat-containing protein n=1 Tax=Salix dunnii TaxID=1413687 RepID=A0A835JPT8_9ROSI|nr:hypothetical protein SADUNF_Sadunf13G0117200 [Salix dunnii]
MAMSLPFLTRPPNKVFSFAALCPHPFKIRPLDPPSLKFPASTLKFLETHYSSSLNLTTHFINNKKKDDYSESTFKPDKFYASLIGVSIHRTHLNQIHARLLVTGLQYGGFLITKLVNKASNIGEVSCARKLFDKFPDPDVFLWNAIVRCYSRHGFFGHAIEMYARMQVACVSPDGFSFPCVLKACSALPALEMGRRVHGQIFRHGFESDVFVQNGLVALYAKCGEIVRANVVFGRLVDRTIVSWTSIISGYAQNGQPIEALWVFSEMRKTNVRPDWIALVSVLRAYTDVEDLEHGKSIHSCVIKMGLECESDLLISLTSLYAKCGQVMVARLFFNQVESPSLIFWNAMISGYVKNGYAEEGIKLFHLMTSKNIRPDSITVTSSIAACAQIGSLELARWMDEYISMKCHVIIFISNLHKSNVMFLVGMVVSEGGSHVTDNHSIKSPKFEVATTLFHPM